MVDKTPFFDKAKTFCADYAERAKVAVKRAASSPAVKKAAEALRWQTVRPALVQAKNALVTFTKEQPKTALFIYICLFCSVSISFFDEPFARYRLATHPSDFFTFFAALNPSGWWFLILTGLWLFYMAVAGLSLTTDVFEKNMVKARAVLFILLTLGLSSAFTLALNILSGRYTPEFLASMELYGFSAFRFHITEISFPSFAVQSLFAVATATATYFPKIRRGLFAVAAVGAVSEVMVASCFISDAVMGAYIGVMMHYVARWIVSENRENSPIISL